MTQSAAEIAAKIGDIARRVLGTPNAKLSSSKQLRFGSNGSIAVEIDGAKAGTWYDFQDEVGGGGWEFLIIKGGLSAGEIPDWLEREIGIRKEPAEKQRVVATYDYTDEFGALLFQVCRMGPVKTFFQRAPDGKGGWKRDQDAKLTMEGVRLVPYHLDRLVAARAAANGTPCRVFIAEGEKDVDKLISQWGLTATTNPMGAGKWRNEYNQYFGGADVVILTDNDEPGRKHGRAVAAELAPIASMVRVPALGGLAEKGDISDWIDAGGSQSDLETLVETTEPWRDARPGIIEFPRSAAARVAKPVAWHWNGWLPKGKFVILAGQKTAGKSTIGIDFLATITRGGFWPDGSEAEAGDVMIWSGEDDFDDTILPRFLAAGGDRNRLFPIEYVPEDGGGKRRFDPSLDIAELYDLASRIPNPKLLMLDPVVMVMPVGTDSHKNAETRRGLQPFVDFAIELAITLLGITHFTKGTSDQEPLDRVTGSLAFSAIPRVVLAAAADAEAKHRRLVRVASNVGPSGGGFEFLLNQEPLLDYAFSAQRVRWGSYLQGAAKDLLEMKGQSELMRATQFLLDQLGSGLPIPVKEINDAARANSIAARTVERARAKLPIKVTKQSNCWCWEMPAAPAPYATRYSE